MTYTTLALLAVVLTAVLDLVVLRTRLTTRKVFWTTYVIILFFQLLTNGLLTGLEIVRYSGAAIIGSPTPTFLGDGRIAYAPVEDLLFGFSLVLQALCWWVWLGRQGLQYRPLPGPPIWRRAISTNEEQLPGGRGRPAATGEQGSAEGR